MTHPRPFPSNRKPFLVIGPKIANARRDYYKNFSARVAQRNTPESDAMEMMMHDVSYDAKIITTTAGHYDWDRRTMKVLARDPMDAIDYARKQLMEEIT